MSQLTIPDFLYDSAEVAARRLLNCILICSIGSSPTRMRIVETEAYDQSDAASHSYKGQTPRTAVMFGPPGRLYVYFTYGMHYCCNVVTGPPGNGSAVLIRAVEPLDEAESLSLNRHGASGVNRTNGPAKLCQALGIDKTWNGHDLSQPPVQLVVTPELNPAQIVQTTRIGIRQAQNIPWRFYIKNNSYVSKLQR